MSALGPHAVFIVLSYLAAALVVAALLAWVIADHRRLRRALADLEGRGIRRRSAGPARVLPPAGTDRESLH